MNNKAKGVILGVIGEAGYGTNPLFTLPLYSAGMSSNDVLFYRYLFAIILYGFWLSFYKKLSLKISLREACVLLPLGLIFAASSLTLFLSYRYMDAGIASTLLFVYPIMVAVIMTVFFKEKMTLSTVFAIVLTSAGVWLLYNGKGDEKLNTTGIVLIFLSALSYALYMIGIKKLPALQNMNDAKLTFYVMTFGGLLFVGQALAGQGISPIGSPFMLGCLICLAIFPTIVALETITVAIRLIGPTIAAVLGAFEPLTALVIGATVFHEQMTFRIICGILLILIAVTAVLLPSPRSDDSA
ncbi:MAG: EamA family transporter [Alphaproteobacteria bacterium]|nr:EamA family transporter [Alphaproteobacteria bacterium]